MVNIIAADGRRLKPTARYGRVRHLLERGEARITKRSPFTIQLMYQSQAVPEMTKRQKGR